MPDDSRIAAGERRMLVESVASFRARAIDDFAQDMDESPSSGRFDDAWNKLAELGLLAGLVCEESGGQGMDVYSFCLALVELALGQAALAAAVLSQNVALWALDIAGELDNAGGVDDFASGASRAAIAWPVEAGRSVFVPGGSTAGLLVLASEEGAVMRTAQGDTTIAVTELDYPLGLRACRPAVVKATGGEGLFAAPGVSAGAERAIESRLLLGVAAVAIGITRQGRDKARAYAAERYQAGSMIIEHEQIRLMLAAMDQRLVLIASALERAALRERLDVAECRSVKVTACDSAMVSTTDAVQVHGGYGYMREYGVERLMRDAAYLRSYPRTRTALLLE
jgi:alkylation response protein AidB-like acyl-CoA dehydrogenase